MRIINENGQEIKNPDLEKGYLIFDQLFIAHHDAVPAIKEQWHRDVAIDEHGKPKIFYKNGTEFGREVVRVVDVPGQEAQDAWDEYEDVQRYIAYTPQELEERNRPSEVETLKGQLAYLAMVTGHTEVFGNA